MAPPVNPEKFLKNLLFLISIDLIIRAIMAAPLSLTILLFSK